MNGLGSICEYKRGVETGVPREKLARQEGFIILVAIEDNTCTVAQMQSFLLLTALHSLQVCLPQSSYSFK